MDAIGSYRRIGLAALILALVAGCAAALRHPTPEDARRVSVQWPSTRSADLERGRVVYVRRCAGCHTLVLPGTHAAEDWPALVEAMSDKARLTAEEKTDVVRFLMALAPPPAR